VRSRGGRDAVMRAGVWPTVVALVVAAVLLVERLQVDWTASCSLQATADSCSRDYLPTFLGWVVIAFVFSLAHIYGADRLHGDPDTRAAVFERGVKFLAFAAITVFPFFGWYLIYVGVAAGFLAAVTIVGLVVAPLVGVMAAGFASGVLLGVAAGPSFFVAQTNWQRLIVYYGCGAALGTVVLTGGQLLYDPAFQALSATAPTWLTALGALICVALSCVLVWGGAIKAVTPAPPLWGRPEFRSGMMIIAAVGLALVVPVHVMVQNGVRLFPATGGVFAPVAHFIRGGRPPAGQELLFAGLRYTGPRAAILARETTTRQRMEWVTLDKGTPRERNSGSTVDDTFLQWRIVPNSPPASEALYLIADVGGEQTQLHCQALAKGRELCLVSPTAPMRSEFSEQLRGLAYSREDGYEFEAGMPHASLAIRFENRSIIEGSHEDAWPRRYCRLNLVALTPAGFSAHQILPCNADWPAEAKRVRAYIEGLFAPP
jgi:hypothetical protein